MSKYISAAPVSGPTTEVSGQGDAAQVQRAKLTITNNGNEEVSYELNGQHMITANHDDDGWSGMERISALMMKVAAEIGANVEAVEGEEDE